MGQRSRRSTHRRFAGIAFGGTAAIVGALLAAPAAGAAIPATASADLGTRTFSAKPVGITYVGMSSPSAAAMAAAPSAAGPGATSHRLPALSPKGVVAAAQAAGAGLPSVVGSPRLSPSTSSGAKLAANFDGVNAFQNKSAAGFDLEPPDEGLGAGNGYVANFVNVTGAIYTTGGKRVTRPFYLNPFFGESDAANISDPRVYFDPDSRRWFATAVEYDFNKDYTAVTGSRIDLAVSTSADPTGSWRDYRINADNRAHRGCPCLADYPILGVNRSNVYISTSEFTSNLKAFNGSQLYAVSKSQLVAGRHAPGAVLFSNLAVAGSLAYHVQPATSYSAAPAEYLMSSLDPDSTYDNRLAVWAVTNEHAVTSGSGRPTLSVRVIRSEGYAFPPNAQTPPGFCGGSLCDGGARTTGVVQTDFDAMQEVQYINGQLVGALNTGLHVAGDTGPRSGMAWFVVRPFVSGHSVSSATHVARQGYLAERGEYLLYPHVNMAADGTMAAVFGLGGPGTYLSAAYSTAAPGKGFGGIRLAAAGVAPDNGFTGTKAFGGAGRWGDYSGGQYVPGTGKIWLATQYIPNKGDGNANWGNRIFALATR
jgi:hypothetical protein